MSYNRSIPVLLCLLLTACNLFDTRDPQNPVSESQVLPSAFTKEILFENLQSSIEQKNIQEYEKLFSDTVTHPIPFRFVPNQSAASRYGAVFTLWTVASEREYFRNILSAVGSSSSLKLEIMTEPQIITYQSDSAHYTFDYLLFVPHNRSDVTVQQFVGRTEIAVSPDKNTIWRIYRWIDFETKKDSSWSELKGQFGK